MSLRYCAKSYPIKKIKKRASKFKKRIGNLGE
jgi:hypothetical protein